MNDLRKKVEDDRGLLKKIEMLIPGFSGYRKREDLRAGDSLLRQQLAGKMKDINTKFESVREELSSSMELAVISDIGDILRSSRQVENKIRHAQQGYTGISADFRIEDEELNKLYEWDLSLLQVIESLNKMAEELNDSVLSSDGTAVLKMKNIKKMLGEFNSTFDKRISVIAGLEVS